MKDLAEGGLPVSNSEVSVWYDSEEDVVVLQCDFMDLNFYTADFTRLVEIVNRARLVLENDLDENNE
jgi:hypothetical protein